MNRAMPTKLTSDRIQDTLYGFMQSQILFTAIDLDIFTCIDKGHNTVASLMEALSLDERGLKLLLNGLVGIGFLHAEPDGHYRLPDDVDTFLVKSKSSYIGGMVHHCKWLYESWSLLTDAVTSGQPVGGAQSLAQLEIYFSDLARGLYVSNYPSAQRLAQQLEIGTRFQVLDILDVAGGSGVWSIAMLEQDAQSRATLLDFPSVTQVAETYIQQHNLSDRFDFLPGDLEMLELKEIEGERQFDLAIMAHVCHMLGPTATQKAFQKIRQVLKPSGRLVIVDFVPDSHRQQPGWPLVFGVNMLISTPEGNVFTESEYRGWLQKAGFEAITLFEVDKDVTAIVATA